jgi:hypothetical protein
VRFSAGALGHGVRRITVDGRDLELTALANPYRRPGVAVPRAALVGEHPHPHWLPDGQADHPDHPVEIAVETH